jgi:hypothetical protein
MAALDALPYVGLVEYFDESMIKLEDYVKHYFPKFQGENVHANVTSDLSLKLNENIEKFKVRVGDKVFERLLEINSIDLKLYDYVKSQFLTHADG